MALVSPSCTIAFFCGYAYGTFERISMNGLVKTSSKVLYAAFGLAGRLTIFPIFGAFKIYAIIIHIIVVLLGLVADFLKDKEDRSSFQSCFNYKEDLMKFKDLIVSGLQTNLVIISRDLQQELFSNQFLNKTLRRTIEDVEILHKWLRKLRVSHESREALRESPYLSQYPIATVEDLLKIFKTKNLQEKLTFNAECLPSPQDPMKRLYEINVSPIIWDTKDSIAVILNDITEHSLNQSLKLADSNKDKMLAMISHELRTPLNGILGVVRILEKQTKDQQTLQYLTICKNSGELLDNLVNSILDLQQIRDNKFSLKMTRLDLYELLNDVFGLFRFQFDEKGLYLNLEISPNVPQYVVTDHNRLRQILINLMGNALKFTYEGGVSVFAELEEGQQDCIQFIVRDTGIGIREEDQEKLFKMYGRAGNQENINNTQGIGFGLEISDRLARLLGGAEGGIRFTSKVGKGSSFMFIIKDNDEKDHDSFELNFFEPQAFAENIENLSLKMSPYSFSMASNSERESTRKPARSAALLNFPSKETKLHIPIATRPFRKSSGDSEINQALNAMTKVNNKSSFLNARLSISRRELLLSSPKDTPRRENLTSEFGLLSPCLTKEAEVSLVVKNMTCHSVLVIDDNSFNLLVAKHLLESLGYKVQTALNGKLAVDLVKSLSVKNKKPFDLILMDLQMPVMDGYEATRELRGMMKNKEITEIPIIALSANDSEDDKRKCREVGMANHLSKPLKEESLRDALEKIFETGDSFGSISEFYSTGR